jgi:predicted TIM-barrel fold metal-dependent hydrolase
MNGTAKTREDAKTAAFAGMTVVDVDTHYTEPGDLWTKRAPAKWRDRMPQARMHEGRICWFIDDKLLGFRSAASVIGPGGVKLNGAEYLAIPVDQVDPACNQIAPRLGYMDEMGVDVQILYPNLLGFGSRQAFKLPADLRLMSMQIYNDAMLELQEESNNRIQGMGLIPWWDAKDSVAEIERCHKMGLRGINTNPAPHELDLPEFHHEHWHPIWEAASDLGLPINFHIGASDSSADWFGESPLPSFSPDLKLAMGSAMIYLSNAKIIGNLIYSGLLEKFPKLKFVSVESGIGWVPFVLEALDYQLIETAPGAMSYLTMKPSEYFKRQIYACFWFERRGLPHMIEALGVDNVMFETDFPHATCLYPNPLKSAAEALEGTSEDFRRKVIGGNAVKLYNLPRQ